MKYVLSVVVAIAVLTLEDVRSQPHLRFQRFSHTDGLSDLTINSITQDSTGFLWIATRDGLNRYDGARFKVFKHVPGDSTSLLHDNVQCVFVDSRNVLWVGTTRGLCRFDPVRSVFHHVTIVPRGPRAPDVNAIAEDAAGTLWLAVAGVGLVRIDRETDAVKIYSPEPGTPHSLGSNSFRCLVIDPAGVLWVGSLDAGLFRFDPTTERATQFMHNPRDVSSIGDGRIEALAIDPQGNLWVGTENGGLCRFDPHTQSFHRITHNPADLRSISSNYVSRIYFDHLGALWLGTQGGGINRANSLEILEFTSYKHNAADPYSMSDDYSVCIFEDAGKVLWIGTGSGLNKVLPHSSTFVHVSNTSGDMLASTSVKAAYKDRMGILWVGTGNGLTRIAGNERKHFLKGAGAAAANEVSGVYEDRNGTLWIATGTFGLAAVAAARNDPNPHFRFWSHDPRDTASLSDNRTLCIFEDQSGTLWVGTDGFGLNRFNRATGRFTRYQHDPADSTSISNNIIMAMMQDSRGLLWVCTMRGLNAMNLSTGRFTRYLHNEADPHSLPNRATYGAVEDRHGRIWVATARGLGVLDPLTGRFANYFTDAGLPDVFLKGIVVDLYGTFWISSRSGLTRVTEDSSGGLRFRTYQVSDGLPVEDFSPIAYAVSHDGELLFGANDGLVRFYPHDLRINTLPPVVAISGLRVFDEEVPITDHITLSPTEYDITIEYAALDYTAPQRNKFEYMLEGLDRSWIAAGRSRSARYANLAPGDYMFRVRGANSDGVWDTRGARLSFTILPPYWATWWFRSLAIGAVGGVLAFVYRYRVRHLLEVERLRTRIATDLHDDVGSALTKIAVHSEVIQTTSNPEKIAGSSQLIGSVSREIITTLSDIVWSIDARHDSITDLAGRIKTFALDTLGAKDIGVHFTTGGLDEMKKLPVDVRQNVYLIAKEAVNNIARHSTATEVWIALEHNAGELRLLVRDNGRGPVSDAESGHGLKNMKLRASRVGGNVVFENTDGFAVRLHVTVR